MLLSNTLLVIATRDMQEYFVHYAQEDEIILEDVIHLRVYLSIKMIEYQAFWCCRELVTVILNDGLEEIGAMSFYECQSLQCIVIPNAVKAIEYDALNGCCELMTVTLSNGLEKNGMRAFERCRLLQFIVIPSTVKVIDDREFMCCKQLATVTLSNGLEEIGLWAFNRCRLLECIVIPNFAKVIKDGYSVIDRGWQLQLSAMGWRRLGSRHSKNAHHYTASSYPPLSRWLMTTHSKDAQI